MVKMILWLNPCLFLRRFNTTVLKQDNGPLIDQATGSARVWLGSSGSLVSIPCRCFHITSQGCTLSSRVPLHSLLESGGTGVPA